MSENYIQYTRGYNKNNINLTAIEKAIIEIQQIDGEHGTCRLSIITNDENVIETYKYLNLAIVFEGNQSDYKPNDWLELKVPNVYNTTESLFPNATASRAYG